MLACCLLRILALREVKESKLLLAFGQCIMKLLGLNIIFETETNFENLNERKKMKDVCSSLFSLIVVKCCVCKDGCRCMCIASFFFYSFIHSVDTRCVRGKARRSGASGPRSPSSITFQTPGVSIDSNACTDSEDKKTRSLPKLPKRIWGQMFKIL